MSRVLIAGCGYVGTELGLRLAAAGHRVWGLRRHPASLPAPLRRVAADLGDPATLTDLPAGLDYVVYAAAPERRAEDAYRAAYVGGVEHLLRALTDQGQRPRRVFFTSSTAVYAQSGGEWVDETSPAEPGHFTGRILLTAEQCLEDGPFAATIVRFGGIYGPGRTRLIDQARRGEATRAESHVVYTNPIHRADCAGVLAHLIGMDSEGEPPLPVYLGVDSEPADLAQVLRWLAEQLGAAAAPLTEAPPRSRGGSKRCSNKRLLESGYVFRYPTFREGYGALL